MTSGSVCAVAGLRLVRFGIVSRAALEKLRPDDAGDWPHE